MLFRSDWKSRWFSERSYTDYLTEDWKVRDFIMGLLPDAAISRIEIERTRDKLRIDVHTARPGIVIGRRGAKADELVTPPVSALEFLSANPLHAYAYLIAYHTS